MVDQYLEVVQPTDNVATALRNVSAGETVTVAVGSKERMIDIEEDVEFGHKIALAEIPEGRTVTKYGKSIGNATEDISPGEWVHIHNVESNYGRGDLADEGDAEAVN